MKQEFSGSCLCGAVRFEIAGAPLRATHCHCRMCQKAAGAAFVTWATFRTADITWTGERPTIYPSSGIGERGFCSKCGSALTYRYLERDNEIGVTAACLDDPDSVAPSDHIWTKSRLDWVRLADGLAEHRERRGKR